jgi:di/tricarboxylate transporter
MNRSLAIKWLISAALAAVFFIVPEQGIYTLAFKQFLTITVFGLALAAFELVPLLSISIAMPAAWIALGVSPAATVMSPWVGTTFLMIISALFMAASLEDSGFLRRIAYYLMCKTKSNYTALLLSITLVSIILNILTSGRGYLVMAPLVAGLCLSLDGMEKKLGAGLAMAVMIGGCQAHAFTYQASGWGVILKLGEGTLSPADYTPLDVMFYNWPLLIVSIVTILIIARWYKPESELGEAGYFKEKLAEMGKMTRREKTNAAMTVLVLVYIFTVGIHKQDVNLGFALIPWLVYIPGLDGADANTVKKVNFPIIFFVAACMSIGVVAASMGVGDVMVTALQGFLQGNSNPFLIITILFFTVFVLNFFMTPMAIISLLTQPICLLSAQLGISSIPLIYALNFSNEAILFPYEYVPYLIVFSFGMISMKDFIKTSILRSILFYVGIMVLIVPYWYLIGLF